MNIISDFKKDGSRLVSARGSYEWWYFDAISDDNSVSFVIIFYRGNPFSGRYTNAISGNKKGEGVTGDFYPAISISVYEWGKPVYYGFREFKKEDSFFDPHFPNCKVSKNEFWGEIRNGKLVYSLKIDQTLPGGDSIYASLSFISPDNFMDLNTDSSKNRGHTWNLVQPAADVKGVMSISGKIKKEIKFSGNGYHDHNNGNEPMKESFKNWYWGRFHFHDRTLVYYVMKHNSHVEKNAWLIKDNGSVQPLINISLADYGYNVFGLKSARQIELSGKGTELFVQQDRILDNGPFYQRFFSRAVMHCHNEVLEANGISEYIYPSGIHNKLFRPLVNMRIVYPDRQHWVQKNPVLYRLTW